MTRRILGPLLAVSLVLLSACATSGNPSIADETRESMGEKLREGVTSKEEVSTMLGDPLNATFINDGKEVWPYELSKIVPLASNYIPYMRVLSSGSDRVEQKLTILFDHDDIVEKYTWSESKVETRRGVLVSPLATASARREATAEE